MRSDISRPRHVGGAWCVRICEDLMTFLTKIRLHEGVSVRLKVLDRADIHLTSSVTFLEFDFIDIDSLTFRFVYDLGYLEITVER